MATNWTTVKMTDAARDAVRDLQFDLEHQLRRRVSMSDVIEALALVGRDHLADVIAHLGDTK